MILLWLAVAAEELEELQHSRNPLLAELRRGKRLRGVNVNDSKALEDEIWKLQHQVFDLKKKWCVILLLVKIIKIFMYFKFECSHLKSYFVSCIRLFSVTLNLCHC